MAFHPFTPTCYFHGWPLEALAALPTERVTLSFLIRMSSPVLSTLVCPTCQETCRKFLLHLVLLYRRSGTLPQRTSDPDVQSLDACSLWEADGVFGRWDRIEGTWFPGGITGRRCWEACLFLRLSAWWMLQTSPSATLTTLTSCLNVGSGTTKNWPQTKLSKLSICTFDSHSSSRWWETDEENLAMLPFMGCNFFLNIWVSLCIPQMKFQNNPLLLYSSLVSQVLALFPIQSQSIWFLSFKVQIPKTGICARQPCYTKHWRIRINTAEPQRY